MKKQILTLATATLTLALLLGCDDGITGDNDPIVNNENDTEQDDDTPFEYLIAEPGGLYMGPTGDDAGDTETSSTD